MKKLTAVNLIAAATFLAAITPAAQAGSATADLAVSATVSSNCTIGTTALDFGAYDPVSVNASVPLYATGAVTVACTKGASGLTIGMGNGLNASGTQRQMANGTERLQYDLYLPPNNTPNSACSFPGTTAWNNTSTLSITNSPNKNARTYNVCGTIPAGQDVAASASAYTDTVVATINF